MAEQTITEDATTLLARLTSKPNVQSTLILSRKDGTIIRSSGLLSQPAPTEPPPEDKDSYANGNGYSNGDAEPKQSAEDVARLVWSFVQVSQALVEGVENEQGQARLMRVRGRRREIVVVPDPKYLLVVVHETPAA